MAEIPEVLREHINSAFPANTCLVATVLPDGFAQVSPRGSTLVYDQNTIAFWDRGRGSTHDSVTTGSKITVYYRNPKLREEGVLPGGGIARFYGTATVYESGPIRDEVYDRIVQPEKDRDPEKKGQAVLVAIERAEDLSGKALNL